MTNKRVTTNGAFSRSHKAVFTDMGITVALRRSPWPVLTPQADTFSLALPAVPSWSSTAGPKRRVVLITPRLFTF